MIKLQRVACETSIAQGHVFPFSGANRAVDYDKTNANHRYTTFRRVGSKRVGECVQVLDGVEGGSKKSNRLGRLDDLKLRCIAPHSWVNSRKLWYIQLDSNHH